MIPQEEAASGLAERSCRAPLTWSGPVVAAFLPESLPPYFRKEAVTSFRAGNHFRFRAMGRTRSG